MYGLFAALGSAAKRLTKEAVLAAWRESSPANIEVIDLWEELLVVLFAPKTERQTTALASSHNKMTGVAADGYVVSHG